MEEMNDALAEALEMIDPKKEKESDEPASKDFVEGFDDDIIEETEVPEFDEDDTQSESDKDKKVINEGGGKGDITPISEDTSVSLWTSPLSIVGKSFSLKEFDTEYKFVRIIDPASDETGYFNVFCKNPRHTNDKNNPIWKALPGVLSDRYVVASLEKFVKAIGSQISLLEEPRVNTDLFHAEWIAKSKTEVNMFDDDTAKLVFSMISGIEVESIDKILSNLTIAASNSYDGTKSLRIDYNIHTSAKIGEEVHTLRDFFTLTKFGHAVEHTGNLSEISTNLTDVKNNIETNSNFLKTYTNIDGWVKEISKSFGKKVKTKFDDVWSNMVDDYRNLFYLLITTSIVLEQNYKFSDHFRVRSVVDRIFRTILSKI